MERRCDQPGQRIHSGVLSAVQIAALAASFQAA
jgi:hypothetical protein